MAKTHSSLPILSEMLEAKSCDELFNRYLKYVRHLGFAHVIYGFPFLPVRFNNALSHLIHAPEENTDHQILTFEHIAMNWITSYDLNDTKSFASKKMFASAPIMKHIGSQSKPLISGPAYWDPDNPDTKDQKLLWEKASQYGLTCSYGIPLNIDKGTINGGISLHFQHSKEQFETLIEHHGRELIAVSMFMHSLFKPMFRKERAAKAGLTKRQKQVIELMVAGHTNQEIANYLEISMPTVSFHMKEIKNKFKLKTDREIVAAAIYSGILDT